MACIGLIGLGVIGTPLAHLLYKCQKENFVLLTDEQHARAINKSTIYINKESFEPKVVIHREELCQPIDVLFLCVKNYSLGNTCEYLKEVITDNTVLVPLQNGIYANDYIKKQFPNNVVLEGFAQGPNTMRVANGFVYQNPGVYHIGTSDASSMACAERVCNLLKSIGIQCFFDSDIKHAIWKKMMLNVAGNASTALTGIDYCMIKNSGEMQAICRSIMEEFCLIAQRSGITISEKDIEDVLQYFITYNEAKHTSMLEDVLHRRQTENSFLAGYMVKISEEYGLSVPHIETIYLLMKIKEDVYLDRL